jgi:uncharacterized membrane protein YphA (DoxX/SURF4 family)
LKGAKLQRLFTSFPSGWSGFALLLLRVLIGFTLMFQGVAYLNPRSSLTFKGLGVGAFSIATGACLLAGLLTPVACLLAVLGSIGLAFAWLPMPAQNALNGNLVIVNLIVMAIAIAVLGPGAFSLDSRMFGRREIVIPASGRANSNQRQRKQL